MAIATKFTKWELQTRILQVAEDVDETTAEADQGCPEAMERLAMLKGELAALEGLLASGEFIAEVNACGNVVERGYSPYDSRYVYDFQVCTAEKGWQQYDTDQDASYFGVWVHIEKHQVLTFVEGEQILVKCDDVDGLRRELASMKAFYGAPPAAFKVFDLERRTVTEVFCERPNV
jgi:hypothetical protein